MGFGLFKFWGGEKGGRAMKKKSGPCWLASNEVRSDGARPPALIPPPTHTPPECIFLARWPARLHPGGNLIGLPKHVQGAGWVGWVGRRRCGQEARPRRPRICPLCCTPCTNITMAPLTARPPSPHHHHHIALTRPLLHALDVRRPLRLPLGLGAGRARDI